MKNIHDSQNNKTKNESFGKNCGEYILHKNYGIPTSERKGCVNLVKLRFITLEVYYATKFLSDRK